jgi:hypothetical protein
MSELCPSSSITKCMNRSDLTFSIQSCLHCLMEEVKEIGYPLSMHRDPKRPLCYSNQAFIHQYRRDEDWDLVQLNQRCESGFGDY